MKRSSRSSGLLALLAPLLVAACQEDEKGCYDRISADLEAFVASANQTGNRKLALAAAESGVAAAVIWTDEDRNICDYVTAGPYLQRE